ncbi:MAG: Na+/H+ antiporter subunit E [Hyphomonadaceae bacterium]|nr:Na+/H+ antiporter subunit E [Hyphomonadaceae bacterium]
MIYLPGLLVALAALWFALSGETAPMFLALGALSVLVTLWLAARLRIIDRDASPYHRLVQLALYLVWLMGQIVKANIAVIAKVLGPRHAIDPALVRLKTSAKTDLGRALFANSITLTPGTVTVDIEGDLLVVHALVREAATVHSFSPMDRHAAKAADGGHAAKAAHGGKA